MKQQEAKKDPEWKQRVNPKTEPKCHRKWNQNGTKTEPKNECKN